MSMGGLRTLPWFVAGSQVLGVACVVITGCGWDITVEATPGTAQRKSLTSTLSVWSSAWSSSMEMVRIKCKDNLCIVILIYVKFAKKKKKSCGSGNTQDY